MVKLAGIERAAEMGDAAAQMELARLYLSGRDVPRDLTRSRGYFARAAAAGERVAIEVYRAFVANGTGGKPDWSAALDLLEGDRNDPDAANQLALIRAMQLDAEGNSQRELAAETLSISPKIVLFQNFVTGAEADYLVSRATQRFQPALIVHPVTGLQTPDPVRTSNVAGFPLALEQPVIHALNRRIAAASDTDVRAGEPLTVLRYRPGQQYWPHLDTLSGASNQRVATMLVYLNDGYGNGETHFPKLGLKLRLRKGEGLLFGNVRADGQPDPLSLHEGIRVSSGEKLVASRWIRQQPLIL
ncbi:MAG: peptidyl prolyl 4-hydroxylase subunit alpha [Sphingomonadales bacterium]|nr:peptidyl prolyl 4-hydroxylase subunit alpha [Sphingomonadales bacterium]